MQVGESDERRSGEGGRGRHCQESREFKWVGPGGTYIVSNVGYWLWVMRSGLAFPVLSEGCGLFVPKAPSCPNQFYGSETARAVQNKIMGVLSRAKVMKE